MSNLPPKVYAVDDKFCQDCDERRAKAFFNMTLFDGRVTDAAPLCSPCLEQRVNEVLKCMGRRADYGAPQLRPYVRFQVYLRTL